jgi:hypothetical protein
MATSRLRRQRLSSQLIRTRLGRAPRHRPWTFRNCHCRGTRASLSRASRIIRCRSSLVNRSCAGITSWKGSFSRSFQLQLAPALYVLKDRRT